jgi:hypothetical protein
MPMPCHPSGMQREALNTLSQAKRRAMQKGNPLQSKPSKRTLSSPTLLNAPSHFSPAIFFNQLPLFTPLGVSSFPSHVRTG